MTYSYTIGMIADQTEGSASYTVDDILADRVEKASDGDLVLYEKAPAVGVASDREVARFKSGRWEYYYEQESD